MKKAEEPDKKALLWTNDKGEHIQYTYADLKKYTHIFAGFSLAAIRCRTKAVHCAGGAGTAGCTDADLAIRRRTKRRGIVIVLAAGRPVGAGGVAMQNDAYQSLFIVRIVRIIGRHLELECAAGGNLDTRKAHLQTIGVLGQFLGAEIAFDHSGEHRLVRHGHDRSKDDVRHGELLLSLL